MVLLPQRPRSGKSIGHVKVSKLVCACSLHLRVPAGSSYARLTSSKCSTADLLLVHLDHGCGRPSFVSSFRKLKSPPVKVTSCYDSALTAVQGLHQHKQQWEQQSGVQSWSAASRLVVHQLRSHQHFQSHSFDPTVAALSLCLLSAEVVGAPEAQKQADTCCSCRQLARYQDTVQAAAIWPDGSRSRADCRQCVHTHLLLCWHLPEAAVDRSSWRGCNSRACNSDS